jgi:peptidoglycan/xylan/chitin deacetylase (PgdA/CDA1 family)
MISFSVVIYQHVYPSLDTKAIATSREAQSVSEEERTHKLKQPKPSDTEAEQKKHLESDPSGQDVKVSNEAHDASSHEETPDSPIVYLTFDDGPSHVTDDILKVLAQYDVEATFFMLEPRMKKYAESVNAIVRQGHAVGLHGVTHDRHVFYQSKQSVLSEINRARKALKEISGVDSQLIRVPYGSVPYMKNEYREAVQEKGYIMWDWNVDSRDWYFRDQRYVNEVIHQVEQLKQGQPPVILLHDLEETYQHLPALLAYLKENQYIFSKLTPDLKPIQFVSD